MTKELLNLYEEYREHMKKLNPHVNPEEIEYALRGMTFFDFMNWLKHREEIN